jgi:hypothetical protein
VYLFQSLVTPNLIFDTIASLSFCYIASTTTVLSSLATIRPGYDHSIISRMLALSSTFDAIMATEPMALDTGEFKVLVAIVALFLFFDATVGYTMRTGTCRVMYFWKSHFSSHNDGSSFPSCCPKRRARFYKCAKRRERRRRQQDEVLREEATCSEEQQTSSCQWSCLSGWTCPLEYARLHLPPPLPFNRRKSGHKRCQAEDKPVTSPVENHAQTISSCDGNQVEATQPTSLPVSSSSITPTILEQTSVNSEDSTTTASTSSMTSSSSSTTLRIMSPPVVRSRSSLMDMARMQQWSALVAHVKRKEAKIPDGDGLYPLHWACSGGAPIEVVEALLQVYRRAARKVDREGSTVLHFACHYGASAAVVDCLLREYPKATQKKDKFGRTPLYHAVTKSANEEVMEKLIQADPSSITTPCHPAAATASQTALNVHSPLYLAWVVILRDRQAQQRRAGKKWNKAKLLLEAAYSHHLETTASGEKPDAETSFRMIPAVITMSSFLPHSVLELAILAFPEQVREQDPITGRLPLHMAAFVMEPHRADDAFRLLLQVYPEAAMQLDAHKQTALVLAIESGKRWDQGVEQLFRTGPDRLHTRDTRSGLAPAILAATASPPTAANNIASETTNPAEDLPSYGLALPLTPRRSKDLEWKNHLQRKRLQTDKASSASRDPGTLHVSTIYELLLQDPSILAV